MKTEESLNVLGEKLETCATHQRALEACELADLKAHAADLS
ncbi:hypothetical protein [Marinobacter shengliensis]|nr:hypothetical protein [Marinobacter shengliensis]